MKIKFSKILFGVMLMSLFLFNFVSAGAAVRTTLLNQDPSPANPGKYVDLKFQIENIGDEAVKNLVLELEPRYPFSLDPNEQPQRIIGNLAAGRQGSDAALVTYRVRVDDKAVGGQNKITLKNKKSEFEQWTYQDFDVNVKSLSYLMNIDTVRTIPEELKPGQKGKLELTMSNPGHNSIRDLSVQLVLASYNPTQGFNELAPLATIQSSSVRKTSFLAANDQVVLTYDIIANPNAQSDIYKVPVIFSYYDSNNEKIESQDIIGIMIGDKPELVTQIENSNVYTSGQKGKLTITIINKGITDAKFVNVKVEDSDDFEVLSTQKEFYVGGVDSDDYESFDIELFITPTTKEKIVLPLYMKYKDPNNKEYQEQISLDLKLYTPEQAKEMGFIKEQNNSGLLIFGGIVVVLFILWKWNKGRKKKLNKK